MMIQLFLYHLLDVTEVYHHSVRIQLFGTAIDSDNPVVTVKDEKQKLLYVFDPLAERVFFNELSEIITGKDLDKAVCSRKAGEARKQTVDLDEMRAKSNSGNLDIDCLLYTSIQLNKIYNS